MRIAGQAGAVLAQHGGEVLLRAAEQRIVERAEIIAGHRDDDDAVEAPVARRAAAADGKERLQVAAVQAAGPQRPDKARVAAVLQRPEIFAA